MKLGAINKDLNKGSLDAFHVPSVLCISEQTLVPGDDVKFVNDAIGIVERTYSYDRHGIVDPFLKVGCVKPGEKFWVMLNPEYISNTLTHSFEIILHKPKTEKQIENDLSSLDEEDQERCRREGCSVIE
jgi:hypothetical protein